ncbi:MAG: ACP S-malonyltransferase [Oscillospiraceae bacterium]
MTSFLFSGQGSQYNGMGKEFYNEYSDVKQIYNLASDICGFDVAKASFDFSAEEQSKTNISQVIIFTLSLACFEVAKKHLPLPTAVGGHSLGEYSALCAGGVFSYEKGFEIIKSRANAMAQAPKGAMYAILKLSPQEVESVCLETEGYVRAVNYNSPIQTVIAGEEHAAQAAAQKLSDIGGKTVRLAVSGAFHSSLMEQSSDLFMQSVKDITFSPCTFDFYNNINGEKMTDFSDMPSYFKKHMISPVRFTNELENMKNNGVNTFIELGPSKVLSGLVKRTLTDVNIYNIEDLKSLEKTLSSISKK